MDHIPITPVKTYVLDLIHVARRLTSCLILTSVLPFFPERLTVAYIELQHPREQRCFVMPWMRLLLCQLCLQST